MEVTGFTWRSHVSVIRYFPVNLKLTLRIIHQVLAVFTKKMKSIVVHNVMLTKTMFQWAVTSTVCHSDL